MRKKDLLAFLTASLPRKLMVALMVLVSAVLGTAGIYLLDVQKQNASADLEAHAAQLTELLSKTLALPLWNIDSNSIQEQLEAVMTDPQVWSVDLYAQGNGQPIASKKRDGPVVDGIEHSAKVVYVRDQQASAVELGRVRVVYTRYYLYRLLTNMRTLILASILFVLASLGVATYTLLRRMVQNPVAQLLAMTRRISEGDFDAGIPVSSRDEIGLLGENFNSMTDKLRQTMERLSKSEEKYRSIYENASEGLFQSSPLGTFISVNPAMARIHGYESQEEMVESITDIGEQVYVDREDRRLYRSTLEDRGKVEDFEVQVRKKNGSVIWISINAHVVKDASGNILYFEGIVEDITASRKAKEDLQRLNETLEARVLERTKELEGSRREALGMMQEAERERERTKEVLERLRESSERLRVLSNAVEQSPASVVITDPRGRIEYVNPKFVSVTGYRVEEVLGEDQLMFASEVQEEGVYRDIRETVRNGREWHGELCKRKKSEELYWEYVSVSAIRNEAEEVLSFLWMGEDITGQKRMHEELKRRISELERFAGLTADRELRMIELKQEINLLREQLGEGARYKIVS